MAEFKPNQTESPTENSPRVSLTGNAPTGRFFRTGPNEKLRFRQIPAIGLIACLATVPIAGYAAYEWRVSQDEEPDVDCLLNAISPDSNIYEASGIAVTECQFEWPKDQVLFNSIYPDQPY